MTLKQTVVLYHGGCVDGFTAAWVARERFGNRAEYVPVNYGNVPYSDVDGRDVFLLDFSYPRDVLLSMRERAKSVTVIDHHKTAQQALAGLDFATFDMERSGAGLTWDVFNPGMPRPWVVDYVEDRDLWRFALLDSKRVNAYIQALPHTFAVWDELQDMQFADVLTGGRAVLAYIDRYVERMSEHARRCRFGVPVGYAPNTRVYENVLVVNAPYVNTSELVGHLAQSEPFAVGWFQRDDGKYQYSLRSRGDVDVAEIAQCYGGGGHCNAAGFVVGSLVHA